MKVECKVCKAVMEYPFNECPECGWKPKGKYAKKASELAKRYEEKHGLTKKRTSRNTLSRVEKSKKKKPHPTKLNDKSDEYDRDIDEMEDLEEFEEYEELEEFEEEEEEELIEIRCRCGNLIEIRSKRRPFKFICPECGRKGVLKEEPVEKDEQESKPPLRSKKGKKMHKKKTRPSKKKRDQEEKKSPRRQKKKLSGKDDMIRCINCNNWMPAFSRYCPNCGFNIEKGSEVLFSSKESDSIGLVKTEIKYDEIFFVGADEKKQNNSCPVCGTQMSFKEELNSYYCPKCKSFY